jgi:acyl dehydratase
LHIDPDVATANGFDRPILHGLCTVGIAARISAQAAGCSPADLQSLDVRLSAPVFPGDTIAVDTLVDSENVDFQARVGDAVVLAGGRAAFGGPMRS